MILEGDELLDVLPLLREAMAVRTSATIEFSKDKIELTIHVDPERWKALLLEAGL